MKTAVCSLLLAALFAGGLHANAALNKGSEPCRSQFLVVETPSQLPELAQRSGDALYLHDTSDGRIILYVEGIGGKDLAIFDVTNPAAIHSVARVAILSAGSFDFVQDVNDSTVLIRYRGDGGGFAFLNLRKFAKPQITSLPTSTLDASAYSTEMVGRSELLLASASGSMLGSTPEPRDYAVLDTTNPANPLLLATVHGVKQKLSNEETGTLFLLASNGLTVVRHPAREAEYAAE